MSHGRAWTTFVIAALLALSGCQVVVEPGDPSQTQTVTPAAVPTAETPTPPPPNGRALGGAWPRQWTEFDAQSAATYRGVEPTCERPAALVIRLQVGALRTDNGTGRGIETTWRFLTPDSRQRFGSVERYIGVVQRRYAPLLEADSVTRTPVQRNGSVATQRVRAHGDGSTTTYRWRVERLSTTVGEDCWLTTGIREESTGSG